MKLDGQLRHILTAIAAGIDTILHDEHFVLLVFPRKKPERESIALLGNGDLEDTIEAMRVVIDKLENQKASNFPETLPGKH